MLRFYTFLSIGIILMCIVGSFGISRLHGTEPNLKVTLVITTMVLGLFYVRSFFMLRKEFARSKGEFMEVAEAQMLLTDCIAGLEHVDFTIFDTARKRGFGEYDTFDFYAFYGSPRYAVLMQMANFRMAHELGEAELGAIDDVTAYFKLNEDGRAFFPHLMDAASKRRRCFFAQQQSAA